MSNALDGCDEAARQRLSALMDGQATTAEGESACATWQADDQARSCWYAYHLIGDVLRTDELATSPGRDAAFLAGVRRRLEAEPVLLAPRSARWLQSASLQRASVAAAVGAMVVVGVLAMARSGVPGLPGAGAPVLARAEQPDITVVSGKLIRDAQLDRYLAAHRRVSSSSSVVVPGAVLRSVDTIAIDDK